MKLTTVSTTTTFMVELNDRQSDAYSQIRQEGRSFFRPLTRNELGVDDFSFDYHYPDGRPDIDDILNPDVETGESVPALYFTMSDENIDNVDSVVEYIESVLGK